ncbi:MAG: hypothetical protein ABSB40_07250 [Nitrososphaeria archaeon]|jgi:hypothetical protein
MNTVTNAVQFTDEDILKIIGEGKRIDNKVFFLETHEIVILLIKDKLSEGDYNCLYQIGNLSVPKEIDERRNERIRLEGNVRSKVYRGLKRLENQNLICKMEADVIRESKTGQMHTKADVWILKEQEEPATIKSTGEGKETIEVIKPTISPTHELYIASGLLELIERKNCSDNGKSSFRPISVKMALEHLRNGYAEIFSLWSSVNERKREKSALIEVFSERIEDEMRKEKIEIQYPENILFLAKFTYWGVEVKDLWQIKYGSTEDVAESKFRYYIVEYPLGSADTKEKAEKVLGQISDLIEEAIRDDFKKQCEKYHKLDEEGWEIYTKFKETTGILIEKLKQHTEELKEKCEMCGWQPLDNEKKEIEQSLKLYESCFDDNPFRVY